MVPTRWSDGVAHGVSHGGAMVVVVVAGSNAAPEVSDPVADGAAEE
jgi:hypothetical protein